MAKNFEWYTFVMKKSKGPVLNPYRAVPYKSVNYRTVSTTIDCSKFIFFLTRTNVLNSSEIRSYSHVFISENKNTIKIFRFTFSLNLHTKVVPPAFCRTFVNHTRPSNPIKLQRLHASKYTHTYICTYIL